IKCNDKLLDYPTRSDQEKGNKVGQDLGKGCTLRPDAAVLADDRRRGEMVALDLTHQVVVHVRLPRHRLASSSSSSSASALPFGPSRGRPRFKVGEAGGRTD
ncbi:hypothetical protein BHE74_00053697, partial [Ensete ventricosum]